MLRLCTERAHYVFSACADRAQKGAQSSVQRGVQDSVHTSVQKGVYIVRAIAHVQGCVSTLIILGSHSCFEPRAFCTPPASPAFVQVCVSYPACRTDSDVRYVGVLVTCLDDAPGAQSAGSVLPAPASKSSARPGVSAPPCPELDDAPGVQSEGSLLHPASNRPPSACPGVSVVQQSSGTLAFQRTPLPSWNGLDHAPGAASEIPLSQMSVHVPIYC